MADEEEKFSGGPDARATKNLDKYYDRVVDLNDQLKYATSLIKDRTTIEKQSINLSNQLVGIVQKMKKGYSDTKDVQKDLSKFSGKANELELQRTKILKDNQGINQKALQLAANIEKGLVNQKATLAQIQNDKAKGLKIDTELEAKIQNQVAGQEKGLATRIKGMDPASRQLYILNKTKGEVDSIVKGLEEENKHQEKINKSMGLTGKLLKGIEKIPIIGQFVNAGAALEEMREHAAEVDEEGNLINSKFSTMGVGIKAVGKQIVEGMLDPLVIITALVKAGLSFDKQLTDLQKGMGISRQEATGLRNEMSIAAASSGDMAVNAERMLAAFSMLQSQLGIAASFSTEMTKEATVMSEKIGLSDDAIGGFAKSSLVVGKSMKDQKESVLATTNSIRVQTGIAISYKDILEKTGKITGQIRSQLGGSVEEIGKAVAVAASLGLELQQVADSGKQMLNFQSSIEAELEAELLTGKELNLEKARMYALTGDQVGLAKEIAKEAGTYSDFQKMNVLQQEALAKSLGMSADSMSDMMFDQEVMNKSAEQLRAEGKGALADRVEARNVEEQMADAVMKLKGVFVDLVGGPVGQFLNLLTLALEPINIMMTGLTKIFGLFGENTQQLTAMEAVLGSIAGIYLAIKGTMLISKGIQIARNTLSGISYAWAMRNKTAKLANNILDRKGIGGGVAKAAGGIFRSLAKVPFGLGIPLAIAAVAGMSSLVYGLSNRKAEKGGMIGGNRHSSGGTVIEAEQGEFIMSRSGVQSVGVDNLHAMNTGGAPKAEAGGVVGGGQDMTEFTNAVLNAVREPGVVVASPYGLNDANYQSRNKNFDTKFE